jgi:hypothetical protein
MKPRRWRLVPSTLQSKEELDLAFLAFGAAFDPIGVQPGKIPCQPAGEALFFHHFSLRARIWQAGKISNVSEHNFHVEAVAANRSEIGLSQPKDKSNRRAQISQSRIRRGKRLQFESDCEG